MKQDNDAVLNAPRADEVDPDTHEKVTSATTTANKRGLRGDDWSHDFQYHHQYAKGIPPLPPSRLYQNGLIQKD